MFECCPQDEVLCVRCVDAVRRGREHADGQALTHSLNEAFGRGAIVIAGRRLRLPSDREASEMRLRNAQGVEVLREGFLYLGAKLDALAGSRGWEAAARDTRRARSESSREH